MMIVVKPSALIHLMVKLLRLPISQRKEKNMSCPHCQGAEKVFDTGTARGDLEEYRKHGPAKTTRLLLNAIRSAAHDDKTLLDIGGGVGAIQHELLADTVQSAVHVDASTAYLGASQEEADKRGHLERV